MTKEVKQTIKLTREKREKKTYDGTPIPEGYVLAPIWLKQDFVNEASYIKSENLTTREYADITFLIGYVAVPPEKYEGLKRDCDEQINAYLKKHCAGRCIIGKKKDGSPKLCPTNNRCKGCTHKDEYERYNSEKDNNLEILFSDLTEEVAVYAVAFPVPVLMPGDGQGDGIGISGHKQAAPDLWRCASRYDEGSYGHRELAGGRTFSPKRFPSPRKHPSPP